MRKFIGGFYVISHVMAAIYVLAGTSRETWVLRLKAGKEGRFEPGGLFFFD